MKKVYLGGTRNNSTWRKKMMAYLHEKEIGWFNPVVSNWTETDVAQEIQERETCDFALYVITPKMTGVYHVAEVVDDSNKRPDKTVMVLLRDDEKLRFSEKQWQSLCAAARIVACNGGKVFENLETAAKYISGEDSTVALILGAKT